MSDLLVVYDGECRFCRFVARLVAAGDPNRRVGLAPTSDARLTELAHTMPEAPFGSRLVAVTGTNFVAGGAAMLTIAAALWPSSRLIAAISRSASATRIVEVGYDLVASRRGLLSHLVPDCETVVR